MAAKRASGRFLMRLPSELHRAVALEAKAVGLSLNEYCLRRLRTGGSSLGSTDAAQALIARATAVVGGHLIGLVVHGSWARDEATEESDVDVLVVIDATVPLTRALYRAWDAEPLQWNGRTVDAHFVHLRADSAATSVWCEAAVDGMVLHERGFALSARLIRVRRDIAAGRVRRRVVHGQPYWTEVA